MFTNSVSYNTPNQYQQQQSTNVRYMTDQYQSQDSNRWNSNNNNNNNNNNMNTSNTEDYDQTYKYSGKSHYSKPFFTEQTITQTMHRIFLGIPLCAAGGALGAYGIGLVSSVTITPLVGAVAGISLVLVNAITNLFFKRFDLDTSAHKIAEVIIDIAVAAFATQAIFAHYGTFLSPLQVSVATVGSIPGTLALAAISFAMFMMIATLADKGLAGRFS